MLNRAFLGAASDLNAKIRSAIKTQLHFVPGSVANDFSKAMLIAASVEVPELRDIQVRQAAYPFEMTIDQPAGIWEPEDRAKLDPYLKAALDRGSTHVGEPALEVGYTASIDIATCHKKVSFDAFSRESAVINLPRDPYLAYWLVPGENRRIIRFKDKLASINPCADHELADFPRPDYYWYFWAPRKSGKDILGKKFDCSSMLRAQEDYIPIQASLERVQFEDPGSHSRVVASTRAQRPLRVSIVYGFIGYDVLPAVSEVVVAMQGPSERRLAVSRGPNDAGVVGFINVWRYLLSTLQDAKTSTEVEGHHLTAKISGKLPGARREAVYTIYLGPTDVFGLIEPEHWRTLANALLSDDVVVYAGHSGLGQNMDLSRISESVGLTPLAFVGRWSQRREQFIAVFSCFSFSYFTDELLGKRAPGKTELLLTGSALSNTSAAVISMLKWLDGTEASANYRKLAGTLQKAVPMDFFLLLEN